MTKCLPAILLIFGLTFAQATAAQVEFLFSGTITSDRDDASWFQGAFPLNGTFTGRISYDPSMATRYDDPSGSIYSQYTFSLGSNDPVALSVTGVGGHTLSSTSPFYINTYDNYPATTPFDEIYFAAYPNYNFDGAPLAVSYFFSDFGVHFNSATLNGVTTTDLPTAPPNISLFENSFFNLYVFSGSGNGPLAYIQGTITSVTPVPEPAAGVVLLLGVVMLLRSRQR